MKKLLAGLLALGLTASAAVAGEIHVLMWSDYIDPEIPQQFEKATGNKVIIDVYEETEGMIAKLQAAGGDAQYDVVVASDHAIPILAKLKLIKPLDLSKVPNAKNVDKSFVKPPYDAEGKYSLPYQWGTVGIIYNKKKLPNFKPSWASILDPAQQTGTYLLVDNMRDALGCALKWRGKSVNSVKLEDLDRAGKDILAAKLSTKCIGFDGSPSACKKVVSGQADMAIVYNGDALNALKEATDGNCDYIIPTEGTIIWVDTMVLPARAPNEAAALAFMNYLLDAKVGAQLSNYINYATPNAAALPEINAEARKDLRIYPTEEQRKTMEYLQDVGKDTALFDEIWTSVKTK